ncbi:MAG TPA: heavy metal translocating P-type ATPase [Candidatus Saccharimonadales bacterium]
MDHSHPHHATMNHAEHNKHAGHSPAMFQQRFWWSLVLTVPVLLFSDSIQTWFHYQLAFAGSQYIPAIFGLVLFWYAGRVFLIGAKAEIADRQPGMMTLISMAITVAFGYSLAITLRLIDGMDFWWELATLITIMIFGHWMEMASIQNAQGALKELAKLLPDVADLLTKTGVKSVSVHELKVGDRVLVRPGAKVPADGEVIEGESEVNESMLTGESTPVKKAPSLQVAAGTINGNSALTIKVVKTGNNTMLAGIMRLVAEAQNSKSKTQVLADRAAFYLTFIAIGAALLTAFMWWLFGHESAAFILTRVVTVLVIACPHALGLAIPLVIAISTTMAARSGLLFRQRMALETARRIDVVLFDKTGTLTKGQQGVTDIWAAAGYKTDEILSLAASLEWQSEHTIGKGIVQKAKAQHVQLREVKKLTALPGFGVQGVLPGGKTYYAVSHRFIEEKAISVPATLAAKTKQAAKAGKTEVYLIKETEVIGAIAVADQIRDESRRAIKALKEMGIRTAMITGDSKAVAAYVARELGLDEYMAEVRPEDKSAKVKELQKNGQCVAMVGDGVNDAPALMQADVGIAIGAGTDVAIESAGIILASSDPGGIVKTIKLARATYRKMRQNLAWAAGYNVVAIPLAAGVATSLGFTLSPAVGAVLMSLSTIIVALNAQFLRKLRL